MIITKAMMKVLILMMIMGTKVIMMMMMMMILYEIFMCPRALNNSPVSLHMNTHTHTDKQNELHQEAPPV